MHLTTLILTTTLTHLATSKPLLPALTSRAPTWWKPTAGTTWQYEIGVTSPSDYSTTPATAFSIDLEGTPSTTITKFHSSNKKVICYFSAGTFEDWRHDASLFPVADKGTKLPEWKGERWVNTRSSKIRDIMTSRMKSAKQKGCDALEPDNMDAYDNGGGGFGLEVKDAIDYIKFLATKAHLLGLGIGLKNAGDVVKDAVGLVDFAVNEQCVQYGECARWNPFIVANKPVFNVEYPAGGASATTAQRTKSCKSPAKFSTILKNMHVTAPVYICPAH